MKPVDQTQFYEEGKSRGNCLQAATASLLGLELREVPNFIEAEEFWQSFFGFLRSRGLIAVELSGLRHFDCYHLAYGQSLRGVSHAVVYRYGELVHDPHPSRAGLLNVDTTVLVVPADLAEFARVPDWSAAAQSAKQASDKAMADAYVDPALKQIPVGPVPGSMT